MMRELSLLMCAAFSYIGAHSVQGAEQYTVNTLRLEEGEPSPAASISEMSWLAGVWSGRGLDGEVEEIWTPPRNGAMIGAYRMIKDGSPIFYELFVLGEANGSLVLRLKHFDAQLRGWEERDDSVVFPFVARREGRMYFSGLTFEPRADGKLFVHVAITSKNGLMREETFRYTREWTPPSDTHRLLAE